MSNVWIVVSDAHRARLFETHGHYGHRWKLVRELTVRRGRSGETPAFGVSHPPTSAPRVSSMSMSAHASHVMEAMPATPAEAMQLVRLLADQLGQAHLWRRFDRLVLVAPPDFLDLLQGKLDPRVREAVLGTVARDLTTVPSRELPERIAAEPSANLARLAEAPAAASSRRFAAVRVPQAATRTSRPSRASSPRSSRPPDRVSHA